MPGKTVQPQLRAPQSRVGASAAPARRSLPSRTPRRAKVSDLVPSGPEHQPPATQAAPAPYTTPTSVASPQRLRQPEPSVRRVGDCVGE